MSHINHVQQLIMPSSRVEQVPFCLLHYLDAVELASLPCDGPPWTCLDRPVLIFCAGVALYHSALSLSSVIPTTVSDTFSWPLILAHTDHTLFMHSTLLAIDTGPVLRQLTYDSSTSSTPAVPLALIVCLVIISLAAVGPCWLCLCPRNRTERTQSGSLASSPTALRRVPTSATLPPYSPPALPARVAQRDGPPAAFFKRDRKRSAAR
jgi:hypothetical protein